MEHNVAKEVNSLMLEYGKKLDESLIEVQKNCAEEDFINYRTAVSKLLTVMLTDVMNPLYKEHPDLKPKELK